MNIIYEDMFIILDKKTGECCGCSNDFDFWLDLQKSDKYMFLHKIDYEKTKKENEKTLDKQ